MDDHVRTTAGLAGGEIIAGGVRRFLGIPYAEPPFGRLRFLAPEPASPWRGEWQARRYGPTPPAAPQLRQGLSFLEEPIIEGEWCLNLNVWAPEAGHGPCPVLVWVPGGGNVGGSNAQPIFDGSAFARDGIVFVSVNYRVGVEGAALIPGAPVNRAKLDLVLALQWVRENIGYFGGDPAAVTVCGSSAGAGWILDLLAEDRGLFRRAVVQSCSFRSRLSPEDAGTVTAEVARRAGVEATVAGLASVAPGRLAQVATDVNAALMANPDPRVWGATLVMAGQAFGPIHEESSFEAVLAGAGAGIELLAGANTDELSMLVAGGVSPDVVAELTDTMFHEPVRALAAHRPGTTFTYEFGWGAPGVGAVHGVELGFVFDNLGLSTLEGPEPPRELATRVHRAWVRFAREGDPGWPPGEPHLFT